MQCYRIISVIVYLEQICQSLNINLKEYYSQIMTLFSYLRLFLIFHTLFTYVFCEQLYANDMVFMGKPVFIGPNKVCQNQTLPDKMYVVFDNITQGTRNSGWLYAHANKPAKFRMIKDNTYEVFYASEVYNNIKPSIMRIVNTNFGYQAIINQSVPSDVNLFNSHCYHEQLTVNLLPVRYNAEDVIQRVQDLYEAAILILDGVELLEERHDYKAAETKGYKAIELIEKSLGKYKEESFEAMGVVAFALVGMERYDEALEFISPYRKSMPDDDDLKGFENYLLHEKNAQDKLFEIDLNDDIDYKPFA